MINSTTERKSSTICAKQTKFTVDKTRMNSTKGIESRFLISSSVLANNKKMKQNYHTQRLDQSKIAFWLSFSGCIVGLFVIIAGIGISLIIKEVAWIGVISGTVIEAVSAMLFYLSDKTNEKISEFFLELQKDSDKDNACDLAMKITDEKIKNELIVKLALHLSGIEDDKICKNTNEVCKKSESAM